MNFVGREYSLIEGDLKLDGKIKYITDMKMHNMLYGKILRSPYAHARIRKINIEKARKLPGVKATITGKDIPQKKFGIYINDKYALAVEKVRFIGDEVAAVAATSLETAEKALELIEVEYEKLPPVIDMFEALKNDSPKVHEINSNIASQLNIHRGDIKKGFKESDYVFEETYKTSYAVPLYLEPMACIAEYDNNGRLNIWAPTHSIWELREKLSYALDIDLSDIRVIQPPVGGSFGGKHGIRSMHIICALLARITHKPVRIALTMNEEIHTTGPRVAAIMKIKLGVKKDGSLIAKETKIIADNGAYCDYSPKIVSNMSYRSDNLYKFKHIQTNTKLVYTNKIPSGAFRGFGNLQMHFAIESMIDKIARQLEIDPLEFRLINAVEQGDTTIHGWKLDSCALKECLKQAASRIDWYKNYNKKRKTNNNPWKHGVGIACGVHVSGNRSNETSDGASVLIKINQDGKLNLFSSEPDLGQGSDTVKVQIISEVLQMPIENIKIMTLDTDSCPQGKGTYSSRVTTIGGHAAKLAAEDLKNKLIKRAAKELTIKDKDVIYNEQKFYDKYNKNNSINLQDLMKHTLTRSGDYIMGIGKYEPPTEIPQNFYGNISVGYPFVAQAVELEIDTETGEVKIFKVVTVHDLGKVINPLLAKRQIEGGVVQGLGYALTEGLMFKDNGEIIFNKLSDYPIFTICDVPQIESILIESNEPKGPFGAKGVSETALVPTAAAVNNAILDAIGIDFQEIPILPQDILKKILQNNNQTYFI